MKSMRMLILDDDQSDLALTQTQLKADKVKFDLKCFTEPEAALEYLRHNTVDVIMTDMILPRTDGLEFIKQGKAEGIITNEPIIVMSGLQDPILEAQADLVGVKLWLEKPLSLAKVHHIVMNLPRFIMAVVQDEEDPSTLTPVI
jgi:CheY-like chemotaxis protein